MRSETAIVQDALVDIRTWARDNDHLWWSQVVLSACDVIEACLTNREATDDR